MAETKQEESPVNEQGWEEPQYEAALAHLDRLQEKVGAYLKDILTHNRYPCSLLPRSMACETPYHH